jgi:hypothetical protein
MKIETVCEGCVFEANCEGCAESNKCENWVVYHFEISGH